jgi:hypothetical protein
MANPSLQIFYDDGILDGQTHGADASGFSNGHVVDPGGWRTLTPLRDIAGASVRSNVVAPRPLPPPAPPPEGPQAGLKGS